MADPDMARALAERDQAMEDRARALAERAVAQRHGWVHQFGPAPSDPVRREQWMGAVTTVAAYRDLAHITSRQGVGIDLRVNQLERRQYVQRVHGAVERARALSRMEAGQRATLGMDVLIEIPPVVDL